MSELVHTGLYGDEAEIVLSLAVVAGSRNSGFDGNAVMKKLHTDYVDLYEIRKHQIKVSGINDGEAISMLIDGGHYYSLSANRGSAIVVDIYQDAFGEVVVKADSFIEHLGGKDISLHEFSYLFKIANNLSYASKILPAIIKNSSAVFEMDSSLLMVCDDADYSLSSIEIPYKKPLKAQISLDTFYEIHDYIIYNERYFKTGVPYYVKPSMKHLYEPIKNPLEIEARRIMLAEEQQMLEQFAADCGRRIEQMRAGIGELKKQASASIVEDFSRYSGVVKELRR